MRNTAALAPANTRRSKDATAVTVPKARAAIGVIRAYRPADEWEVFMKDRYLAALALRVQFPGTLAQLAARTGVTKDQYAGELRRALRYADRISRPVIDVHLPPLAGGTD